MWCWSIRPEGNPSINYTDVICFLLPPRSTIVPAGEWKYDQASSCALILGISRRRFVIGISSMHSSSFSYPAYVVFVGFPEFVSLGIPSPAPMGDSQLFVEYFLR